MSIIQIPASIKGFSNAALPNQLLVQIIHVNKNKILGKGKDILPVLPRQPTWHLPQVPGPPENEVFHIASAPSDQATYVYIHIFIYAHIYK